jgi:hypothetical protein
LRVGCPIRISTDQRLLAAPRGFSQRATSFIASWCQGIHRMPFLYSISRSRPEGRDLTMHRNHPQRTLRTVSEICVSAHIDVFEWPFLRNCSRSFGKKDPSGNIVHNASEPSSPTVGAPLSPREWVTFAHKNNNSRSDKSVERRDLDQSRRTDSDHTRPETHQNLIHNVTKNNATQPGSKRHDHTTQDALPRHVIKPNSDIRDTDQYLARLRLGSHRLQANDCRRERTVPLRLV